MITILIILLSNVCLQAQDLIFRQFPTAYLYYNPAYAGLVGKHVVHLNSKYYGIENINQGLRPSISSFLSYDTHFSDSLHSVGILAFYDNESYVFESQHLGGIYSFNLIYRENLRFKIGTEISYNSKSIDFSRLILPDQIDPQNGVVRPTIETFHHGDVQYMDTKLGAVFKINNLISTFSVNHILSPNTSLIYSNSTIPMSFSGTLEYYFLFFPEYFVFKPGFLFNKQDIFYNYNLLLNFSLFKHYKLGLIISPSSTFGWMIGIDFLKHWTLFFYSEKSISDLALANFFSYEGGISYRFSK
ncbi:MAG: hypothetical protein A3H98_05910 [Bacteroidetes bacterium RIFCSPLOWO2_02_FULL_36_8]|nr:MAG: hypothetical protein A3H98_05910 [Bacteroidetes bacterium RIFCSPLOWO2_02_FULL_36_8]OFY68954.1 MAG: hypothetical protein A3G23_10355 [Bacteroidetes bacterium RIFCSPLOWO2_12_FULL_37_12]